MLWFLSVILCLCSCCFYHWFFWYSRPPGRGHKQQSIVLYQRTSREYLDNFLVTVEWSNSRQLLLLMKTWQKGCGNSAVRWLTCPLKEIGTHNHFIHQYAVFRVFVIRIMDFTSYLLERKRFDHLCQCTQSWKDALYMLRNTFAVSGAGKEKQDSKRFNG